MKILDVMIDEEQALFTSPAAHAFFEKVFGVPVSLKNSQPLDAWTKVDVFLDGSRGVIPVLCRMVGKDIGGVLLEERRTQKEGLQGMRNHDGIQKVNGVVDWYCMGVKDSNIFWLYKYNYLARAMFRGRMRNATLSPAQVVVWRKNASSNTPKYICRGIVVDPEKLRGLLEKEAEHDVDYKGYAKDESPL